MKKMIMTMIITMMSHARNYSFWMIKMIIINRKRCWQWSVTPPPRWLWMYSLVRLFGHRYIRFVCNIALRRFPSLITYDDSFTRDMDKIQTTMWDEEMPLDIRKGMLFNNKNNLQSVVKISSIKTSQELRLLSR